MASVVQGIAMMGATGRHQHEYDRFAPSAATLACFAINTAPAIRKGADPKADPLSCPAAAGTTFSIYWPEPGPKLISTRRFCGSRTPSAVCTSGRLSPNACVVIDASGTPLPAR